MSNSQHNRGARSYSPAKRTLPPAQVSVGGVDPVAGVDPVGVHVNGVAQVYREEGGDLGSSKVSHNSRWLAGRLQEILVWKDSAHTLHLITPTLRAWCLGGGREEFVSDDGRREDIVSR